MFVMFGDGEGDAEFCMATVQRTSGIIITTLSVNAVILNCAILTVYIQARHLLTPQYFAIINVVASDLCSAIVGVTFRGPGMINPMLFYGHEPAPCPQTSTHGYSANLVEASAFCMVSPYLAWAFAYQNAAAIAIMSVDRMLAVALPFWYKVTMTKKLARRITYITWISVCSYLLLHSSLYMSGVTVVRWEESDGRCMYREVNNSDWRWKIFEDLIFFVVPFVITFLCYVVILIQMIRCRADCRLQSVQRVPLLLTVAIVVFSCVPWIFYFICHYSDVKKTHADVMVMSYVFFYVSPIINPVIFSTRSRTFNTLIWDRLRIFLVRVRESLHHRLVPPGNCTVITNQQARTLSNQYSHSSASAAAVPLSSPSVEIPITPPPRRAPHLARQSTITEL